MKRIGNYMAAFVAVVGVSAAVVTTGCNDAGNNGDLGLSEVIQFSADGEASVDFGLVEAESGSKEVSATVTNSAAEAVTVTAAVVNDTENYTLSTEALPMTIAPGEETTVSVTFQPQSSGVFDAELSFTAEGFDESFAVALSGEGNYAPAIGTGYAVDYNGAVPDLTGFYMEDGTKNGKPKYKRTAGTVFYLFYFDSSYAGGLGARSVAASPDPAWVIDESLDIAEADDGNEYTNDDPAPDVPESGSWAVDSVVTPKDRPAVLGNMSVTGEATVYYGFTDADGDIESGSTIQWYRDLSETGEGTPISGATSATYSMTNDDEDYYIWAVVTPAAESGIETGAPVKSEVAGPIQGV